MYRILSSQPLLEVRSWLDFYITKYEPGTPQSSEKCINVYNACVTATRRTFNSFQLDVRVPAIIPGTGTGLIEQILATTYRFNIDLESLPDMFLRKPNTLRWQVTGYEIRKPRFFPSPKPR